MLTLYTYNANGFVVTTEGYDNLIDALLTFDLAREDINIGRLELFDDGHDGTRPDLDPTCPPVEYSHRREHHEPVLLKDFTSIYCNASDTADVEAAYNYYGEGYSRTFMENPEPILRPLINSIPVPDADDTYRTLLAAGCSVGRAELSHCTGDELRELNEWALRHAASVFGYTEMGVDSATLPAWLWRWLEKHEAAKYL